MTRLEKIRSEDRITAEVRRWELTNRRVRLIIYIYIYIERERESENHITYLLMDHYIYIYTKMQETSRWSHFISIDASHCRDVNCDSLCPWAWLAAQTLATGTFPNNIDSDNLPATELSSKSISVSQKLLFEISFKKKCYDLSKSFRWFRLPEHISSWEIIFLRNSNFAGRKCESKVSLFWFGVLLYFYINRCRLFNAESSLYISINIFDL